MIVIDASLGLELAADTIRGRSVADILPAKIAVPSVFDLEVLNSLRRLSYQKQLDPRRADDAAAFAMTLPAKRYSVDSSLERVWQLRHNMTAYDASYVALAEMLDCELWTLDAKFPRVPKLTVPIRVF